MKRFERWFLMGWLSALVYSVLGFSVLGLGGGLWGEASHAFAASSPEVVMSPMAEELLQALEWRQIGPYRGGRVTAVTGVRGQPMTFYFGASGGGVWKTADGGTTWRNVSDGQLKTGTVGALAVAPSDPNVVYAGMGESAIRGVTTSHGDGIYRSTDAGETWQHRGLVRSRQISTLRIHPTNPDLVYAAVQGNPWVPSADRGIYRSVDGGRTWLQILFVDEKSGASDLVMDPSNPRILYAALWEHQRLPWKIHSGGPGSGVHKTTDGGDTWSKINGLPEVIGKIGLAMAGGNSKRLWALVEAEDGGLFRTDDGGATWLHLTRDRLLRARSWYYTKVFSDPQDANTVYVLNAPMLRSIDGGRTFEEVKTPHSDQHDLWIDPDNSQRMINGNDGGANVSFNGGATWTTQANQPTAQIYRVITDAQFPYSVYGGQQDNTTLAIASRGRNGAIGREDWRSVGGCESAHIAFDPQNPRHIYAGCYQGLISAFDTATGQRRNIMAYPVMGLGSDPIDEELRFNWNAPIVVSPHDPQVIYHAGNVLLQSLDQGNSWQTISPDLTRNDPAKLGSGGGPITNEAAGAETYHTIFYLVESPHQAGTLWVGTDDGLVHVSEDGGGLWSEVTPEGMPEFQVNAIEVSPHDPAKVYLAVTGYKLGDLTPYLYRTTDRGATWQNRVEGIAPDAFVRVVREDPQRAGLLYAGTESGLYVSFDDGEQWQPFQLNLPVVSITDLTLRRNDLVAATQGRGFWILDDLTPLHTVNTDLAMEKIHLFPPRTAYRWVDPGNRELLHSGTNPPAGAILNYLLAKEVLEPRVEEEGAMEPDPALDTSPADPMMDAGTDTVADSQNLAEEAVDEYVLLEIIDPSTGRVLRSYSSRPEDPPDPDEPPDYTQRLGFTPRQVLPAKAGMNRFVWDLQAEQVRRVEGLMVPAAKSYRVAPGTYRVRLTAGSEVREQDFEVLVDPRLTVDPTAYEAQQRLIAAIWRRVDGLHEAVNQLREVRHQVEDLLTRLPRLPSESTAGYAAIETAGTAFLERIDEWQNAVVQVRQKTFQDVINFPNRLNSQYLFLLGAVADTEPPVTAGAHRRYADLEAIWQQRQAELIEILEQDLVTFNGLVKTARVPAVVVPLKTPERDEAEPPS